MNVSTNADTVLGESERGSPDGARPERRWQWSLLRVVVVLLAADLLLQAVFAGRFLSGDFTMLGVHQQNANFGVFTLSLLQIVTAIIAKAPRWLVVMASVLAVAVVLQMLMGFSRVLGVHVPLGVAIIATMGWIAVWVLTHRPGQASK